MLHIQHHLIHVNEKNYLHNVDRMQLSYDLYNNHIMNQRKKAHHSPRNSVRGPLLLHQDNNHL